MPITGGRRSRFCPVDEPGLLWVGRLGFLSGPLGHTVGGPLGLHWVCRYPLLCRPIEAMGMCGPVPGLGPAFCQERFFIAASASASAISMR